MYITYFDLVQMGIFIVALIGLCYTILIKVRKNEPPITRNSERHLSYC